MLSIVTSGGLQQRLLLPRSRVRPPTASSVSGSIVQPLTEALPFLSVSELLSDDVEYSGLGLSFSGRDAYVSAASKWRKALPTRLPNFECSDVTVLPPDARGIVNCRYRLSFDAPVPPAVLPGQRRRLAAAQLVQTPAGRTRVTAIVVATLQLDGETQRVRRVAEQLVADPFAVTTSIAHFELLNARVVALMSEDSSPLIREPLAYWQAMRGMMRIELEESVRQSQSDEARVLADEGAGSGGVSDAEFEAKFRVYIFRVFLLGASAPALAFAAAKALRAAVDSL